MSAQRDGLGEFDDVRRVLREDLDRRLNHVDQSTLEQVLERVAFGDDVVSATFFRAFEDMSSSWIQKVWSLKSDNVEGAKSEIMYLLVMSIVRRAAFVPVVNCIKDVCVLIRKVGYDIATLWCVCRLFVAAQRIGNLKKLVCDNDDKELLRSTLIRDLKRRI